MDGRLRGVVRVNADVFSGEIGGDECHGGASAAEPHSDIAVRLRQVAMGLRFIERMCCAIAADHLLRNKNAHFLGIDGHA